MRGASDLMPVLAAIKALHNELIELRREVDELKDEVKVMERSGGHVQFVLQPDEVDTDEDGSDDSDSDDNVSVQSAPAAITYDRSSE